MDLACFNGEFYVVDYYGKAYSLDSLKRYEVMMSRYEVMMRGARPMPVTSCLPGRNKTYFVESAGALLVLFCYVQFKGIEYECHSRSYRIRNYSSSVTSFRVVEALPGRGNYVFKYSEVKNLGNRSLFLRDRSASFSIEVSDTCGCKANCIYFTNDGSRSLEEGAVMDMSIFDMEDRKIKLHLGESSSYDPTKFVIKLDVFIFLQ